MIKWTCHDCWLGWWTVMSILWARRRVEHVAPVQLVRRWRDCRLSSISPAIYLIASSLILSRWPTRCSDGFVLTTYVNIFPHFTASENFIHFSIFRSRQTKYINLKVNWSMYKNENRSQEYNLNKIGIRNQSVYETGLSFVFWWPRTKLY